MTGVGMSLLALAASPVVAAVFRSPQAGEIAAVTAGMLALHGLTNVPDGLMQRRFNFRRRLIVDHQDIDGILAVHWATRELYRCSHVLSAASNCSVLTGFAK